MATVVEHNVRLSESVIWRLQLEYYRNKGPSAWASGQVPSWVTNNPRLASLYAEVAVAYGQDCLAGHGHPIDQGSPINIVELGAGSGALCYRVLRALDRTERIWKPLGLTFRYVATDQAEDNVDFWQKHPLLRPYIDTGRLDVAVYSPADELELRLRLSGEVLTPGALANPLVLFANYFVDSLPTDLFRVEGGRLFEGRTTTTCKTPLEDGAWGPRLTPDHLGHLTLDYQWDEVDEPYPESLYNEVLHFYAETYDKVSIPFPIAALKALEHVDALSAGRFLWLLADKAPPPGFGGEQGKPVVHGAISLDANLDVLREVVAARRGLYLRNHEGASLDLTALAGEVSHLPTTELIWSSHVSARDPSEYILHFQSFFTEGATLAPATFVTILSESGWDPHMIRLLQRLIIDRVGELDEAHCRRLLRALELCHENYFPIGEATDTTSLMGALALRAGDFALARRFYLESLQHRDQSHVTMFNLGVCDLREERWNEAVVWFERCLDVEPEYASAQKYVEVARTLADKG
ncbi:MAG: hypothetical protein HN348_18720 [Proteobacteria bacterium]|nr:hypothetical protein [Pseudomonadota bacterium]